jgi:hypothetical protein
VNDTPTQFDRKSSHSFRFTGGIEMPLELEGIISFLTTREDRRWRRSGIIMGVYSGLLSIVMTSDQVW